jgi:hypothetical protein
VRRATKSGYNATLGVCRKILDYRLTLLELQAGFPRQPGRFLNLQTWNWSFFSRLRVGTKSEVSLLADSLRNSTAFWIYDVTEEQKKQEVGVVSTTNTSRSKLDCFLL